MINTELERIYLEDKNDRESLNENEISEIQLQENDKIRLRKVYEMIEQGQIDEMEIWNCHYLSLILLHGDSSADFELAHHYAKKAVEMGSNVSKWLYAASLDKHLLSKGEKQKFGTQFDLSGSEPKLAPYDETTTDEEREKYGVPKLKDAVAEYKRKYSLTS